MAASGDEGGEADGEWMFLTLPKDASAKLPSRGMVSVEGTCNDSPFQATIEPDGKGGHWLKVERELREAAGAAAGDTVSLAVSPLPPDREPEPNVPADLRKALAVAAPKAREAWSDITPAARRDFIHWITSGKRAETRVKRIATACDMLAKGKRRPCCFDRSGMYANSLSCPVAAPQ
ncbi:MAG: YdeI/OmpD-associated family protein [Phycisphaerales bacterium]